MGVDEMIELIGSGGCDGSLLAIAVAVEGRQAALRGEELRLEYEVMPTIPREEWEGRAWVALHGHGGSSKVVSAADDTATVFRALRAAGIRGAVMQRNCSPEFIQQILDAGNVFS